MFDYNIFLLKHDDELLQALQSWFKEIQQQDVRFNVYRAKSDDERLYRRDTELFNYFNMVFLNSPSEMQATIAKTYKVISDCIYKNKDSQIDMRVFIDSRVTELMTEPLKEDVELLEDDVFAMLNDSMQSFHVLSAAKALATWLNEQHKLPISQFDEITLLYSSAAEGITTQQNDYSEDLLAFDSEDEVTPATIKNKAESRLSAILSDPLTFSDGIEEVDFSEVEAEGEAEPIHIQVDESDIEVEEEGDVDVSLPIVETEEEDISTEFEKDAHVIKPMQHDEPTEEHAIIPPSPDTTVNNSPAVDMKFLQNARRVQRQLFGQQIWSEHKSIGVWSPVSKLGVTTFVMNYATFLAENRVYVGVLEALRTDPALKERLQHYTQVPDSWCSYANTIHNHELDVDLVRWQYKNVLYLPLDRSDASLNWDAELLGIYLDLPGLMDVTLIDMPTGEMNAATRKTLEYLTELWILVDDNHFEILSWYNYIHELKKQHNLEIKLIFNKAFSFSPYNDLCQTLNLPLLAVIPALHEEMARNNYQNGPVISVDSVRSQLYEPYKQITKHVMGQDFVIHAQKNKEILVPSMQMTYWNHFMEKLKSLLKVIRSA